MIKFFLYPHTLDWVVFCFSTDLGGWWGGGGVLGGPVIIHKRTYQSLGKAVTEKSRNFLEPHYFGDIIEPVLKLVISIVFLEIWWVWAIFTKKVPLHRLQPPRPVFFLSRVAKIHHKKNTSGWLFLYSSNSVCILFT